MTEYLSCAETAKIVRKALKENFPGQTFSVRSDTYSMGASIDVRWTDGPTTEEVDKVVGMYEGAGFDGMIDLKYYHTHYRMPDGRIIYGGTDGTEGSMGVHPRHNVPKPAGAVAIHMGADYIHTNRDYSPELLQLAVDTVAKRYNLPAPALIVSSYGVHIDRSGDNVGNGYFTLGDLAYQEAAKISLYKKPAKPEPPKPTTPTETPKNVTMLNPNDPATPKQLWALHCITRQDTRQWNLTKSEASALISKSKAGEDIKPLCVNF
jgi:hypothetical protein